MRILITGGGGLIGRKLGERLCARGRLRGRDITELTLIDLQAPSAPQAAFPVKGVACDIADKAQIEALFSEPYDVVYHLAAALSGGSEADFDMGMRVNLFASMHLLEAARQSKAAPVFVFASSAAVHGGEEAETVTDESAPNPQTSYGTQKAMIELLLTDMSRKGFVDGRALRLPTVSIRPGKPNTAASSFMSSIFREPLQGQSANCPVGRDFPVWHTAPRTVVNNFIHAAEIEAADWGYRRAIDLPGRTDSIGEMIDAMTNVAGEEPASHIAWAPDPVVEKIVRGWRAHYRPEKGLRLGFKADESFEDSVRWFLEDDIAR